MYRTYEIDGDSYLFEDETPLASQGRSGIRLHPSWEYTVNSARATAMFVGVTIPRLRDMLSIDVVTVVDRLGEEL